ncbi:hypothetical protein Q5P01_000978 [Channa striata]|uniref:Uncharacterized protein n=1 Tax=Channa striata TaxID=64152 RepID=A0AA88IWC9_CHASR|nr:hypothetical protein Q5P01_000978 [Channa striata]
MANIAHHGLRRLRARRPAGQRRRREPRRPIRRSPALWALLAGAYGSEEKLPVPVARSRRAVRDQHSDLRARRHVYRVVNIHHGNRWPVGFLEYSLSGWSLRNLPVGYSVRDPVSELDSEDCYHKGTYRRLRETQRSQGGRVDSGGYCGFHAP